MPLDKKTINKILKKYGINKKAFIKRINAKKRFNKNLF